MSKDRWGFNKWASSYDEDIIKADRANDWIFSGYESVLNKVVEYCGLEDKNYSSVLDIGIGTGNLAKRFLPRGMRVIGIEPSAEMRKICRHKYPDIKVMAGDFLKTPRSLPNVDVIVSAYAFHHLTKAEKAKAIPVMKQLLKPKGRIVIADLMFQNAAEEKRIKQGLLKSDRADILEEFADEYPALFEELKLIFEAEGFSFKGERLTKSVWILRACL
ncbi:MAG: class I SAM-dependent methyltransferase [Dehalococcoidales bacterium]